MDNIQKTLKHTIIYFNKNKNINTYKEILFKYFDNYKLCNECNNVIYYYNSGFKYNKHENKLELLGPSYNMQKHVNKCSYNLSICSLCIEQNLQLDAYKIPKNKWFNMWNKISIYAFNLDNNAKQFIKNNQGVTLKKLIEKYGEVEGLKRWDNYRNKQAITNTYEYKKNKYGWDKDQFDDYNKSRAVTVDNLILKYGEYRGLEIWYEYVNKQKITKSKEYYTLKYGQDAWENLCKSKSHTLENYLKWHKDYNIALEKYIQFHNKFMFHSKNNELPSSVSKSSQKYFKILEYELKLLKPDIQLYYYEKDKKEYMKFLNGSLVYLDFYIKDFNICIEFNGDIYHGNPKIFSAKDKPMPHFNDITCEELWLKDKNRIDMLKIQYDIDTIVIWESELPNQKELAKKIIEKYEKL